MFLKQNDAPFGASQAAEKCGLGALFRFDQGRQTLHQAALAAGGVIAVQNTL